MNKISKKATLVLKTSDLLSSSNNNVLSLAGIYSSQYGSFNNKLSSFTWYNINLRTLLGDMYDKYDEFNLCLNQMNSAQSCTDSIADNRNLYITMGGLPWINQTYSVRNSRNSTMANIGTLNFNATGSVRISYSSDSILTFGKSQELCNLTLEYNRIVDDVVALPTTSITGLSASGAITTNTITVTGTAVGGTVQIGMIVVGAGIPSNTFITLISGSTYTLSNNLTIAMTSVGITINVTYPNVVFIFDIFGIPKNDDNKNGDRLPIKSFIPAC